jgi:hypothetical protein
MISWQVRAFSQPSCPATTWAATIFDMYEFTIDMQVKQQNLTQGDMSFVSLKNMLLAGQVVHGENVGSSVLMWNTRLCNLLTTNEVGDAVVYLGKFVQPSRSPACSKAPYHFCQCCSQLDQLGNVSPA